MKYRRILSFGFLLLQIFGVACIVQGLEVTTFGNGAIALEPGKMGPNALPVPFFYPTRVGNDIWFELMGECHYNPAGDVTLDPYISFFFPLRDIAAFSFFSRPIEYFRTSDLIRDERHAKEASGLANGDLYFQTMIQFASEEKNRPLDIAFHLTLKTTTGKSLENARHINAPAYFFDFTGSKTLINNPALTLRAAALISFIAWQVNVDEQNDAYGYGLKIDVENRSWLATMDCSGYTGWIGNGDRPLVVRSRVSKKIGTKVKIYTGCQVGLHDQSPLRVELGTQIKLSRKPKSQM